MSGDIEIGRNSPCPCGSEKKYKKCCLSKDQKAEMKKQVPEAAPELTPEEKKERAKAKTTGNEFSSRKAGGFSPTGARPANPMRKANTPRRKV